MKTRREKDFISLFDPKSGIYIRSGIIRDGKDTGIDPFQSSFPELLDVGIMGHCIHGKTGLCVKAGIECYQDGLHSQKPNMAFGDFESIVGQCKGNTYQIALGGCGDPDQHERFEDILSCCRSSGIIPNFTTSGYGMTKKIAALCRKYCGAVAVSWYRSAYTERAIHLLLKAGVKTNIHFVLSKHSIHEAVDRLSSETFPMGINAVVFLLHKPVGLGKEENMLTANDPTLMSLIRLVNSDRLPYKVGFDSCTVPALINHPGDIDLDSLDTCEGGRWSAYISADMKMMPCSFDNQEQRWMVDLRKHSIKEAWDSQPFEDFRNHFRNACPECKNRRYCMGGCPIRPQVVLCNKQEKN